MRKKLVATMLTLSTVVSLTGCVGSQDEINSLNSLQALNNTEDEVSKNYNLSYADEQDAVYNQVLDRTMMDLSNLAACDTVALAEVTKFMDDIDNQLIGKLYTTVYTDKNDRFISQEFSEDDEVINSTLTSYMLSFFEQTPYYWQRSQTEIMGMDSASRSVIVDVTYNTIGFNKDVINDSHIVEGDPDYDKKRSAVYHKWLYYLESKSRGDAESAHSVLSTFKQYYGDPEEIIEEQTQTTPVGYVYDTGNQRTYNGLIDSDYEQLNGSVKFRFILKPRYVLGVKTGMSCDQMYMLDFDLESDPTEGMKVFTDEGYATVTDSVYSVVNSYFKAVDESNYNGLYKLMNNFETLDKYYHDMFENTVQKHTGFTLSLFSVIGTHVTCGITVSTKERACFSDIVPPIYTDRYYAEIELKDDKLAINNLVLVSRKIEGEPDIIGNDVSNEGFMAKVDLTKQDMVDIEKLICDFSSLQLKGDYKSEEFSKLVDTSITTNQLENLRKNMDSFKNIGQKVVFLESYQQGTSNFASVRVKELYQNSDNYISEVTAIYEFITKGDKWYIYNYEVASSIRLDSTELQTNGCLCLVMPGKVVSYNSMVQLDTEEVEEGSNGETSESDGTEEGTDAEKKDLSSKNVVVIKYSEYTPVLKSKNKKAGVRKITVSEVGKKKKFDEVIKFVNSDYDYAKVDKLCAKLNAISPKLSGYKSALTQAMTYYINRIENRYSSEELITVRIKADKNIQKMTTKLLQSGSSGKSDNDNSTSEAIQLLSSFSIGNK